MTVVVLLALMHLFALKKTEVGLVQCIYQKMLQFNPVVMFAMNFCSGETILVNIFQGQLLGHKGGLGDGAPYEGHSAKHMKLSCNVCIQLIGRNPAGVLGVKESRAIQARVAGRMAALQMSET